MRGLQSGSRRIASDAASAAGKDSDDENDSDWQNSLSSWTTTRRGSLQVTGAVHRAELVDAVRAESVSAELLRASAEVRQRNRPLSERLRERFRSLDALDDSDEWGSRRFSAHSVEELVALRIDSAAAGAAAGSSTDYDELDSDAIAGRLGLRLSSWDDASAAAAAPSPVVRVTSVDLDSPADRSGIHPGDEILSVDDTPAEGDSPADVARRLAESVLADGVAHLRVRRRLHVPREAAPPPVPPLDTLPSGTAAAAAAAAAQVAAARDAEDMELDENDEVGIGEICSVRNGWERKEQAPRRLTAPPKDFSAAEQQLLRQRSQPRRSMPNIRVRTTRLLGAATAAAASAVPEAPVELQETLAARLLLSEPEEVKLNAFTAKATSGGVAALNVSADQRTTPRYQQRPISRQSPTSAELRRLSAVRADHTVEVAPSDYHSTATRRSKSPSVNELRRKFQGGDGHDSSSIVTEL